VAQCTLTPGNRGSSGRDPHVRETRPGTLLLTRDERFEAEALPQLRTLYGVAYRMTGNVHDAEDLVQETFLRAYRAFDRFNPGTNARAWLITILQRVRTDAFRRRQRRPATVELMGDGPATPPPQDALASGGEDLERALGALPEPFRTAVVLRDVQELSYAEIAEALEIPVGTVMSRIHRGRAQLRETLSGRKP
jgi:RNA polymerase sigma-70 factor, ECF subfamily